MSSESCVRAGAAAIYGTSTLFKDIALAGLFRFPNSNVVYAKVNARGWYTDGAKKFKTGVRTAVFPALGALSGYDAKQTRACELNRARIANIAAVAAEALNAIGSDRGTDLLEDLAEAVKQARLTQADLLSDNLDSY